MNVPCDLVLIKGSALLNESCLTGESIPVMKSAFKIERDKEFSQGAKKYQILSGTSVI
jgi:cation-transporting P-type ATPase 13A2